MVPSPLEATRQDGGDLRIADAPAQVVTAVLDWLSYQRTHDANHQTMLRTHS